MENIYSEKELLGIYRALFGFFFTDRSGWGQGELISLVARLAQENGFSIRQDGDVKHLTRGNRVMLAVYDKGEQDEQKSIEQVV